jgi:hypothetical protein
MIVAAKNLLRLSLFAAVLTFALAVSIAPVRADPGNGNGWGQGDGGGKNHGAPGPLVGAGLPAVLLIGGAAYLFLRRTRCTGA